MHLLVPNFLPEILLLLKHKNVKLAWRLPNYCNVSSWRNNIIKLTYFDEKKKRAYNSQLSGGEMPNLAPLTYINLREIQVNVTINSHLLLDRALFYHFYSGIRT